MQSSIAYLLYLAAVASAQSEFFIGGYSGELESGAVGIPSTSKFEGSWFGESTDCSTIGTSSPFPTDTDDVGRLLYKFCDTKFGLPDWEGGATLQMGGSGNRCGQPITSDDVNHQIFANVYNVDIDPGMTKIIGLCIYNTDTKEDCATDGSIIYQTLISCSPYNDVVIHKGRKHRRALDRQ